jgi:hypothetical protein
LKNPNLKNKKLKPKPFDLIWLITKTLIKKNEKDRYCSMVLQWCLETLE